MGTTKNPFLLIALFMIARIAIHFGVESALEFLPQGMGTGTTITGFLKAIEPFPREDFLPGDIQRSAWQQKYQDIMTLEPGNGKPCIRGMRITVYDVLAYLASGMTSLSPEGAK